MIKRCGCGKIATDTFRLHMNSTDYPDLKLCYNCKDNLTYEIQRLIREQADKKSNRKLIKSFKYE